MQADSNALTEESLVAIQFIDALSWSFVSTHAESQNQIFQWFPTLLSLALNIPVDRIINFALQVSIPDNYTGPKDVGKLLTSILVLIPENMVTVLQNEIMTSHSPLYAQSLPYSQLADIIDRSFKITSVDANAIPGTPVTGLRKNNSRMDAIIGVVSALGSLAFIILGVLIFRSVKRSRELLHRRLFDPNMPNDPYPDRTGRDFDQDSVGGQRRRSFYFAEDSLRGQQPPAAQVAQAQTEHVLQPGYQTEFSYRTSPESMRERRVPVVPGAISAPILTQSSLNW